MAVGGKFHFEVDGTPICQRENCGMCETSERDGYCSQCEIYFCQKCFDRHLKSKLCMDHVLLQDADESNGGVRFDTCAEHKQHVIKHYCTEHKCCGCAECILVGHSSCKLEYIVDASNRFQDSGDLARLLEEVQGLEYSLDKYMEAIDKHTKTAETINKDVLSDIETLAKSLVEHVAGSKQQVLDDAKGRESAHQQKLVKLKGDVQSLGSQVEKILTDFRNEDMVHKRFLLAVETMPKVARIQNKIAAIDCNNVITDYTFRPSNFLKRMTSYTPVLGRLKDASQIEDDEEDDEELKKEREKSLGLEQHLEDTQKMLSELKIDVLEKEKTYNCMVSKLNADIGDLKTKYDKAVKDKQTLEKENNTLKIEYQCMVSKLNADIGDLKSKYDKAVKDKQTLEKENDSLKIDNQCMVSKLNADIGDLKSKYDKAVKDKQTLEKENDSLKIDNQCMVSKLNADIGDLKSKYDKAVKDKQTLEKENDSLKIDNQCMVSKLNTDIGDLKSKYDKAVKDKQTLEKENDALKIDKQCMVSKLNADIGDLKSKYDQIVNLSCGHENPVGQFNVNKLMVCCICGITYGDQPNGTFTSSIKGWYIELTFRFPNGTQSKLNRNPGQPYSGISCVSYLRYDEDGSIILNMMNVAFQRKCLFTINSEGNIQSGVELLTDERLLGNSPNDEDYYPNDEDYYPNDEDYYPNDEDYYPNDEEYNPNDEGYNPNDEDYYPNDEDYYPNDEDYNPNDEDYYPNDEDYYPNDEEYNPNDEGYNPNDEGYNPNDEGYNPNYEGYNPNDEGYNPNYEGYNPNDEGYNPNYEGYNPNDEGYNPNEEGYNPNDEEYNSMYQEYVVQVKQQLAARGIK